MKQPKRIVIFNWRDPQDPQAGGAERVTLKHASYWVRQGHQVTWISGRFPGCSREESRGSIHFIRLGNSNTLFLRAWWIFFRELRGQSDVIIDEIHGLPMFSPLWAGKRKVIAFIHEVAQEIWDEMLPFPINVIGKGIERYIFPLVYQKTHFWVDCQSTQNDLITLGIQEKRITIIPCAIETPPELKNTRKEKTLTCIFVARLVKMKGVEYALETFKHILFNNKQARFWIVGSGESVYMEHLKKLVKELGIEGKVKFYGNVSEKKKYELLARSHFLIHTSLREGFGLTVLEANSQHTPAAVFDVAALRDLVSSQVGIIVPFGDTHMLATTLVKTWESKKRYLSIQKKAYTFSKSFSWRTFTKQSELLII